MIHRSARACHAWVVSTGLSALHVAARHCPRTNGGPNGAPFHTLVVHTPTRVIQQAGHHPISIAAVFVRQFDDVVDQLFFISPTLWNLSLRGPVLAKRAAGAALGDAGGLPYVINAATTTRRAQ